MLSTLATQSEFEQIDDDETGVAIWDRGQDGDGEIGTDSFSTTEVENALNAWTLAEERKVEVGELEGSAAEGQAEGEGEATQKEPAALESGRKEGHLRVGEDEDDPILFLSSVFPSKSNTVLQDRFALASDLETLVEELMNEDYIASSSSSSNTDYSSDYSSESSSSTSTSTSAPTPISSLTKQQRRRLKASTKASSTISLTDVLHRLPPPAPPPLVSKLTTTPLSSAPKSRDNTWVTMDSTSSYLAALLRIQPGRITSLYHRENCSLTLTVSALLTSLISERPFSALPSTALPSLRVVLPFLPREQLELLLSATEGDVSDSIDLQSFLEALEAREGTLIQNGLLGFGASRSQGGAEVDHGKKRLMTGPIPPGSLASLGVSSSSNSRGEVDWNLIKNKTKFEANKRALNSLSPSSRYTAEECQALALDYLIKRNDAYRSAARAFQKGGGSDRGAAWYWADIGREMDGRKRGWEEKAAFALVGERRSRNTSEVDQVDLHGLTLNHALSVVKSTCNTWYSSSRTSLILLSSLNSLCFD